MTIKTGYWPLLLGLGGLIAAGEAGAGNLEVPANNTYASGIGIFTGWHCNAGTIQIELLNGSNINGQSVFEAAYGTYRKDTEGVCGDTDNGFGLLVNFNNLGAGTHTARALADGVEFGRTTFTVTPFSLPFMTGLAGTYELENFPAAGETTTVQWQEATQNFVIVGTTAGGVPDGFYLPGNFNYSVGMPSLCGTARETGTMQVTLNNGMITLQPSTDNALEINCAFSGPETYPACTVPASDGWFSETELEALASSCDDPRYAVIFGDVQILSANEIQLGGSYLGVAFTGSITRQ